MARQHLNAMTANYVSWHDAANGYPQDVYAVFLRHIVVTGLAPMPWPAVVDILVGHNPQRLLAPPDKHRTFHERLECWREGGDLKAHGLHDGVGWRTGGPVTDIDDEITLLRPRAPTFPSGTATYGDYVSPWPDIERWNESDADPLADIDRAMAHLRGDPDAHRIIVPLSEVNYQMIEMLVLAHHVGSIVLDIESGGGMVPGPMEPSIYEYRRNHFAKRYSEHRPENPFDFHRHDPTKRHDTYRAMRRANKARGKRRG